MTWTGLAVALLWHWLAPKLAVLIWVAAGVIGLYLALWAYILGKSD